MIVVLINLMTLPTVIWCRNTIATIYSFVFYKFSPYPSQVDLGTFYLFYAHCWGMSKTRRPKSKGVYKSCLCLNRESQVLGFWVYQPSSWSFAKKRMTKLSLSLPLNCNLGGHTYAGIVCIMHIPKCWESRIGKIKETHTPY